MTFVMALFENQTHLTFKQGYDSVRQRRRESAVSADTAQSERHFYRNLCAVCASLSVPPDTVAVKNFTEHQANIAYDCDILANAKGYEFLASQMLKKQGAA